MWSQTWILVLAQVLTNYMNLIKELKVYKPQCSHLYNGENNIYFKECWESQEYYLAP